VSGLPDAGRDEDRLQMGTSTTQEARRPEVPEASPEPSAPATTRAAVRRGRELVNVTVLRAWLDGLGLDEGERRAIVADLALTESQIKSWDLFVSREIELALVRRALAERGPAVGIEAAQSLDRGAFAVVEYLMRTSPDLSHALDQLVRYERLLGSTPVFTMERDTVVQLRRVRDYEPDDVVEAVIAEFALGSVLVIGGNATARPWHPTLVRFTHAAPLDVSAHERLFRCPVEFEAPHTELVIARGVLDTPMAEADSRLHALLRECGRALIGDVEHYAEVSFDVRQHIGDLLPRGQLTLRAVAERLAMSTRTLQHRLRAEGASFSELVDGVRTTLAQRYLVERRLSVPDIAALLGYGDASAFHRAFKRWTGLTPRQFRARNPS
jgi:AraC-like DNA-binding protein